MPNELNPKDPRNLWQSQERENVTSILEEIRLCAARFERRIWWRNFREYAAGVLLIAWFLAPFARLGPSGTRPADCRCGLYHDSNAVAGHGALASRRCGYQLCRVAGTGALTRRFADRLALLLVTSSPRTGGYLCGGCHQTRSQCAADRLYHSGGAGVCRSLGSEPVGSPKTQPQNPGIAQDGGR